MTETWRPVAGFEGRYEISDLGRVASLPNRQHRNRIIMRQAIDACGYPRLRLCTDGKHTNHRVHGLVAAAFLGQRPAGKQIRHIDGDPRNCTPPNLAYGTVAENSADTLRHGRHRNARKTECVRGHAFDSRNTRTDADGSRQCRPCRAEKERARRAARRTERTS